MVKTRFAPSPTGKMHVGNLRTALYSYFIARHAGGTFMLRIEDTDQERYVPGAVDIINRTLAEAGIVCDEGPDKDGGVGPYVQSERVKAGIYQKYAEQLVAQGDAYYCFCTKERLESLKVVIGGKEYAKYDKHCLHLSREEVAEKLAAGVPHVIRLNVPEEGSTTFHDINFGDITVENAELDDMILIKSDGYPTYNFANVVDDHLMGVTHVVRGKEYLSSSPKYNLLYKAFGWEVPVYVHCPLIMDENHQKLSKRSGHSSFEDLLDQGFLPEAVVNYTALLGWSPEDDVEIMSMDELIEKFDYTRISKSDAVFDIGKLRWMNGEYIRRMSADAFFEKALPYIRKAVPEAADSLTPAGSVSKMTESSVPAAPESARAVSSASVSSEPHDTIDAHVLADLAQSRIETFEDIPELLGFFHEVPEYSAELYRHKKMKTTPELSLEVLKAVLPFLEELDASSYTNDMLFTALKGFAAEHGWKNGQVMWPIRTALSGKESTPGGATQLLAILGKEESLKRIRAAVEKLEAEGL